MKVMTIVGTRPELIKLSEVIKKLDESFEHCFVHTGQNYDFELNEIFYRDLELRKPDHYLEAAGKSAAQTIGQVIAKVDLLLEEKKPDAVVIYGDTNSCLSVIAAKRRHIPVFHMEAGNRCFDQRVPEEINRKIVDHLSDINFVHSEHARDYLKNEGLRSECIIRTGSPLKEIYLKVKSRVEKSLVHDQHKLKPGQYFLVSFHREENVDNSSQFQGFINSLAHLREVYPSFPIIVSTHPRTRKKIEDEKIANIEGVHFLKPLGFVDYLKLQQDAFCVISDSGTLTEESSLLGFPGVMIRQSHERPEGMDYGVVVMSALDKGSLLGAIKIVTQSDMSQRKESIPDYHNPNYSEQILRCIHSYIPYINRTVWYQ